MIDFQLFANYAPYYIKWNCDISNIKIGSIITIKNCKEKINGITELFSNIIIRELAHHEKTLLHNPEFIQFIQQSLNTSIITKKDFNNIPYFKFIVDDIYFGYNNNPIIVINPISIYDK